MSATQKLDKSLLTVPDAAARLSPPRNALSRVTVEQVAPTIPRLERLAVCFGALAETLDTGDMFAASWNLELVAQDMRALGTGLADESRCLQDLIALNLVLSNRIGDVADDVRLLVAMVSNAKVEMASIDAPGESLEGFGQTLETLAYKAKSTLREYQIKHEMLLGELRKTSKAHGAFETGHRDKLAGASREIDASVATFRSRHKIIAAAAAQVADAARTIIGRLAEEMKVLQSHEGTEQGRAPGPHLLQLASKVEDLASPNNPLVTSRGEVAASFLSELDPKLKAAGALIKQCQHSRVAIDKTAVSIVSTFETLEALAAQVAAMVIDMTIIGTNAIVKSFRLGQRGAGLSIIAQHLRSHALKVAEGITLLTPAMANARSAAKNFTTALESQDAARMAALADRTAEVVSSFARVGRQTTQAMQQLEREAVSITIVLQRAAERLGGTPLRVAEPATSAVFELEANL